jgi:excisionase family DNA binding protein
MLNRLMTPQEAAEFLGISVGTLYMWTSAKKIPHMKIGGKLRFAEQQLWEWARQHIVEPIERPRA